jgi:hypothetical protein
VPPSGLAYFSSNHRSRGNECTSAQAGEGDDPLDEAELDRLVPPIDEDDPEWQAYVRRKVQESLDDPRPSIPAEEVRRQMRELHEEQLKRQAKN